MDSYRNKSILDSKIGSVLEKNSKDKVELLGDYLHEDSNFADNIKLIVYPEKGGKEITVDIPYSGYEMKLFLGDFNGDGLEDILIRGNFGGSGGYIISTIYSFYKNSFINIFNQDVFDENFKFQSKYLNGYKAEVISLYNNKKFTIDIGARPKVYLDLVYDKYGKVKPDATTSVSGLNEVYPINSIDDTYYTLFTQQRIIGVVNADTLGIIESFIDLKDNKLKLNIMGVLILGEDETREKDERKSKKSIIELPDGAEIVSLDKYGGEDNTIKLDLDYDKKDELVVVYKLDFTTYLAVYRKYKDVIKLLDIYDIEGKDLDMLYTFRFRKHNCILIGYKINNNRNKVKILSFSNDKIIEENNDIVQEYSRMEIDEGDKRRGKQIALWKQTVDSGYEIDIYDIGENNIKLTDKYDKYYYKKVVDYYKDILKDNPDSGSILYYLVLALYKTEQYEEALDTIDKIMDMKNPYPSMREIISMRVKIVRILNKHKK